MTRVPLAALVGGVITYAAAEPAVGGERVPLLVVEVGSVRYQIEAWRDEEGNGPGHLDIERAGR